ncbi:MAG: hypothetical protein K5695_01170 [Oscillospiraceae bacterium]|nr:hypothetical protein [Oscillospiraceae bacterium]
MRKKDMMQLLGTLSEEDAAKLAEQHLVLTKQEHERILGKIEQRLTPHTGEDADIIESRPALTKTSRFGWVSHAVTAAACVAIFAGTFAGMFWLNSHAPAQPDESACSVQTEGVPPVVAHVTGDRYVLPGMTKTGALYMTVTDAVREDDLLHVTLTLESEDAVFYGQPEQFFTDNFLADTGREAGLTSPCRMAYDGETGALPHSVILESGETAKLELWYPVNDAAGTIRLFAGTSQGQPYTEIRQEDLR